MFRWVLAEPIVRVFSPFMNNPMSQHHPAAPFAPASGTQSPAGDGTAVPPANARAATRVGLRLLLAVIGCTTLLTGCVIYPDGAYYAPGYGSNYGYPGYGFGEPYYYYGGVSYYFYGGRYFYYRNHQRCYVSGLPHGGHYNRAWSGNRRGYTGAPHNVQGRTGYQQQQYRRVGAQPSRNVAGRQAVVQRGSQPAKGNQPSQGKGNSKSKKD